MTSVTKHVSCGRLNNKLALITGAANGIGAGIALEFAKQGSKLILLDIASFESLKSRFKYYLLSSSYDLNKNILYLKCDITKESQIKNSIKQSLIYFNNKKIDILVNNAAKFVFKNILNATMNDWKSSIDVNILGHALMIKNVVPFMNYKTGLSSIINIASVSSFIGQPNCITYALTKTAMLSLTRNVALDLQKTHSIRVNAICPGAIYTDASDREMKKQGWTFEEWQNIKMKEQIIKRAGTTKEVAYAAVFFASDESTFCTGSCLMVDGGHTAL